jgi:hypothetical protein
VTVAAVHFYRTLQTRGESCAWFAPSEMRASISHVRRRLYRTLNTATNLYFARPKKVICGKLPSCPGSRPTLTKISVVLSTLMQKCWILASVVIVTFRTTLVFNTWQDSNI